MAPYRILITVLDQFAKNTICDFVSRYSAGTEVEYHLVYVVEPPQPRKPGDLRWERAVRESRQTGQSIVDELSTAIAKIVPPDSVHTHVREGAPAEEILRLAEEVQASLITLGTRGRKGLVRLLLGSVSAEVTTHAKCSVIVLRQPYFEPQLTSSPAKGR